MPRKNDKWNYIVLNKNYAWIIKIVDENYKPAYDEKKLHISFSELRKLVMKLESTRMEVDIMDCRTAIGVRCKVCSHYEKAKTGQSLKNKIWCDKCAESDLEYIY